ncbi:uncharacterized protein T551_00830 [Pneumocystis jirovecii RU7]|uniref:UBX domain-containing protein n=1 Tax=Pneumocystis jirovecii (strain RU7) TaxID=1408657 RepID=A0A0W4ZUX0_PNEJ7|nr:uncharacterized protein T551_00830 [Pneumocystis jirovecii RU7]KTW32148.1 hypothetical protein T551_00830 [Pneumocystis jirovecii RU7]
MDDVISQFCSVTCASLEEAKCYLDLSSMNLEQAIILYFELKNAEEKLEVPMKSDDFEDNAIHGRIRKNTEKSLFQSQNDLKSSDINGSISEARNYFEGSNMSESILKYTQFYSNKAKKSVFDQSFSSLWEDTDSFATPEERSKKSRLAYLFRPPFDIMKNIDLETAQEQAKDDMLWVMVNLQDNTDFSCQKLNRDLWKDQRVKDIVLGNFIFLQYTAVSPDGILYQQFYPIKEYPHIAIIDPRTGERVKVLSNSAMEPDSFLMELHDFLEKYSLDSNFKNPVIQKSTIRRIEDMTEVEQVDAALIESIKERKSNSDKKISCGKEVILIPDDDIDINYDGYLLYFIILNLILQDTQSSPSLFKNIPAIAPPEPVIASFATTYIQFRFPDGSKKVRLFNLSDKISRLFEYIKSELPLNTRKFELMFNRVKLINELNQTLNDLKLKNVNITVEFA